MPGKTATSTTSGKNMADRVLDALAAARRTVIRRATYPTRPAVLSGSVAGLGFGRLGLSLRDCAQGVKAFLAVDVFTIRQDHTKQLGMSGSKIVDDLSHGGQELLEPFARKLNSCDQGLQG